MAAVRTGISVTTEQSLIACVPSRDEQTPRPLMEGVVDRLVDATVKLNIPGELYSRRGITFVENRKYIKYMISYKLYK